MVGTARQHGQALQSHFDPGEHREQPRGAFQSRSGITTRQRRAEAQEGAKFEAGRVYFPRNAPFLPELEAELLTFPQGKHDDQVDSITQALAFKVLVNGCFKCHNSESPEGQGHVLEKHTAPNLVGLGMAPWATS